jgi:hypothetical protein
MTAIGISHKSYHDRYDGFLSATGCALFLTLFSYQRHFKRQFETPPTLLQDRPHISLAIRQSDNRNYAEYHIHGTIDFGPPYLPFRDFGKTGVRHRTLRGISFIGKMQGIFFFPLRLEFSTCIKHRPSFLQHYLGFDSSQDT